MCNENILCCFRASKNAVENSQKRYFNPVYIISSLDQEISFLHTKNKPVSYETKKNKIPFETSNPFNFPEAVLYACNMRSKYFKGKKRVQIKFCTRMQLPENVRKPIRLWALIWGVVPHKTGWLRNNGVIFYMLSSYRKFKFTTGKKNKKVSYFVRLGKGHEFFWVLLCIAVFWASLCRYF